MNFSFISAIIGEKWAIDPLFAINSYPLIADLLNGEIATLPNLSRESLSEEMTTGSNDNSPGKVGLIKISGALTKNDQPCGVAGMSTIGNWIKSLDNSPDIKAIVLKIDSPGGTVKGTETLANIIKSTKKPIVAYVDGLMASAALWIGTAANEVWASSDIDEVGSVGVLVEYADLYPAREKDGVKFHKIVSSLSPDKTKLFDEIRSGKYENYIKEKLDPIAEKFQKVIRDNRPKVKDEHLTGKVYFARDVMGVFVDQIGTIEQAISRANDLAKENESKNLPYNNESMKYERISAAIGEESLEFEADGSRTFSPEEMQALDEALTPKQDDQAAQLQADLEARDNELNALRSEKQSLNENIVSLEEQIATLQAMPPAEIKKVVQEVDGAPSSHSDGLTKESIELYNMIKR